MDIDELRELREQLEEALNYCPPDNASPRLFKIAEARAEKAGKILEELEPVFALLDAIDDLAARMERLERLTGHYEPDFDLEEE